MEPPQFYASQTDLRDVTAVETRANISENESVCLYGRSSNDHNCSLRVENVSQACTNDNVFNNRLVMMDGDVGITGDSGGGWSFGGTAYGSHKGNCCPDFVENEAFSVASLYGAAIGAEVRIA